VKCGNCGVEILEEDFFFNDGVCDECRKKLDELQKEFTS
jgi:hypothetical protein